jgi:hypothetical protein
VNLRALGPPVDSSESLLLRSGLGYVSIFGLSSLSLYYSLKKKKYHLFVIFISMHIKINKKLL